MRRKKSVKTRYYLRLSSSRKSEKLPGRKEITEKLYVKERKQTAGSSFVTYNDYFVSEYQKKNYSKPLNKVMKNT